MIAFVSLFALDVFGEGLGFWETLAHLFMHLIPTFVLVIMLIVAWRWEWAGALLFTVAGMFFFRIARPTLPVKLMFAAPLWGVAALFLANWLRRAEIRPGH